MRIFTIEDYEKYKKILEGGEKETMENFEKFIVEVFQKIKF